MKKEITFIYMDSSEKANYEPIAEEAIKRGYKVNFTDNKFEECEIGFYCQHINFPQFSKFSVIMLHDITQQYGNWPDIWIREPWNKYDVGILPSYQWEENWKQSSIYYYAHPKRGVYRIGWPKADFIADLDRIKYKNKFYNKYGLDREKKTVLYAPAWENDNKQDDFVQSMLPLDVNILIKQWDANPNEYPNVVANIMKMYQLHKNNPRVTILPPETNIFHVIAASDILVSEESSTMSEATMMGIPAISVSDWLIPDVEPSRYPECNYDFVFKTTKENLGTCVENILNNYDEYQSRTMHKRDITFCNIGYSSPLIMNIIDDCVCNKNIRYKSISSEPIKHLPLKRYLKHKYIIWNREIRYNYCARYLFVRKIWNVIRMIKHFFVKKHIV